MAIESVTCPDCGATGIQIDTAREHSFCSYCGATIHMEEARRIAALEKLKSDARQSFDARRYDDARAGWQKAIQLGPMDHESYWGIVRCQMAQFPDTPIDQTQSEYSRAWAYSPPEARAAYVQQVEDYNAGILARQQVAAEEQRRIEEERRREQQRIEMEKYREQQRIAEEQRCIEKERYLEQQRIAGEQRQIAKKAAAFRRKIVARKVFRVVLLVLAILLSLASLVLISSRVWPIIIFTFVVAGAVWFWWFMAGRKTKKLLALDQPEEDNPEGGNRHGN